MFATGRPFSSLARMTVLYKYMKREYADPLLTKGELLINTLYEYRDKEKHGAVIGDDSEGKKLHTGISALKPGHPKHSLNLQETFSSWKGHFTSRT